jgi:hypothetical protein
MITSIDLLVPLKDYANDHVQKDSQPTAHELRNYSADIPSTKKDHAFSLKGLLYPK